MKANLFKNFKTLKEKEEETVPSNLLVSDVLIDEKYSDQRTTKILESEEIDSDTKSKNLNSLEGNENIGNVKSADSIKKKRPVKKEVLEARAKLQTGNSDNIETYSKKIKVGQDKRTFTIFLKSDSLEFLKNLVFYKVTAERQIFYNQSEAVIESLELIMTKYKSIAPRPDFIREQEKNKKGGRKRNSDEIYDVTTTIYIPGQYYDFIKDVTYNNVVQGNMYFKDWDLLESSINMLKNKYGENIKPRPDYIRQEEKLRAKKAN